jgi:hypothetical protein
MSHLFKIPACALLAILAYGCTASPDEDQNNVQLAETPTLEEQNSYGFPCSTIAATKPATYGCYSYTEVMAKSPKKTPPPLPYTDCETNPTVADCGLYNTRWQFLCKGAGSGCDATGIYHERYIAKRKTWVKVYRWLADSNLRPTSAQTQYLGWIPIEPGEIIENCTMERDPWSAPTCPIYSDPNNPPYTGYGPSYNCPDCFSTVSQVHAQNQIFYVESE